MKQQKLIFILVLGFTTILACTLPNLPAWKPTSSEGPIIVETIPQFANLFGLDVEPRSGYGPFQATLHYFEGREESYVTCGYKKKDDPNFIPKIIGDFTLTPGKGLNFKDMDFSEKVPATYLAYCVSGEQKMELVFAVVSPFAGEYACENCFSETWATDVYAGADAPRSMGRSQARITIDHLGNVASGYLFFEVYGTPPADHCGVTRDAMESSSPYGTIDHNTRELIVDFSSNRVTIERGGGNGQCDPPETSEGSGAIRVFFQAGEDGNLLLCKPFETGQVCMDAPMAVLLKKQ